MPVDPKPIYQLINDVPKGEVASYGMIASLLPGVTARMVGKALSSLETASKTPWHRIVQSGGTIAERLSAGVQRQKLEEEGVAFRRSGAVDWSTCRWRGPSRKWIARTGADPEWVMETVANWRGRNVSPRSRQSRG